MDKFDFSNRTNVLGKNAVGRIIQQDHFGSGCMTSSIQYKPKNTKYSGKISGMMK
jgi:hypothetical protein